MSGRHASDFDPMPKKTSKPKQPRTNPADEVMTRGKLEPFFENIKELIISTAKGTETVLRKDIRRVESELHLTQVALKTTKDELNDKIDATKDELRAEIKATKDELRSEIKATKDELRSEIKDTETRLRGEIKDTETRLSDKIDKIHVRQDDHEDRITALEGTHP
jgi:hypothetical protein